jgi:flagellar protein FliS
VWLPGRVFFLIALSVQLVEEKSMVFPTQTDERIPTVRGPDADKKRHQVQGNQAMFTPVSTRAASAYKTVAAETGVQGADPHQLVNLLFDALLQAMNQARGALERGDMETKAKSLSKAVRILEEGLRGGLNLEEGGDLAQRLQAVYAYSVQRLTLANMRNDGALIAEVTDLIEPVAQSWKDIRATALQPATGPGA